MSPGNVGDDLALKTIYQRFSGLPVRSGMEEAP